MVVVVVLVVVVVVGGGGGVFFSPGGLPLEMGWVGVCRPSEKFGPIRIPKMKIKCTDCDTKL